MEVGLEQGTESGLHAWVRGNDPRPPGLAFWKIPEPYQNQKNQVWAMKLLQRSRVGMEPVYSGHLFLLGDGLYKLREEGQLSLWAAGGFGVAAKSGVLCEADLSPFGLLVVTCRAWESH